MTTIKVLRSCVMVTVVMCCACGAAPIPPDDADPPTDAVYDPDVPTTVVCGRSIEREGSWRAVHSRIYLGDREVPIWGLNWFGLETPDAAPHGLWERSMESIVDTVRSLGFTALRVPVAPTSIKPGYPSAPWSRRGEIDTGREQLETLLAYCRSRGMYVLLDFHTCDARRIGRALPGSPIACEGYDRDAWLDDLRTLATLAERYHPVVMGVDLCNEPHALRWSTWRTLATDGGNAVLCANPRILVFVGGVGNASYTAGRTLFWGENLLEAAAIPVLLPRDRFVYSPHVYGPSVARMEYFNERDFPRNMPAIWDAHFGYLARANYNVLLGEFCGWYDDARAPGDVAWQDALVDWMRVRPHRGFFYWALNPNAGSTGGVLLDDWRTPDARKVSLLRRLIEAP